MRNKGENKRSDIVLETKPKRFGIVPEFLLLKTYCFDLIQNLRVFFCFNCFPSLVGQIERISFDKTNSGKNSLVSCFISIRYQNVCGTFAPLLF
jgi:hypothetical protein